jgi:antitoxin ParD1/3/4
MILMETMNISLPDNLKGFVDSRVKTGSYSSVSEYVRDLVREDQLHPEGGSHRRAESAARGPRL